MFVFLVKGGGWPGFMATYMKRGYLEYRGMQDRVSEWKIEKFQAVKTTLYGSLPHLRWTQPDTVSFVIVLYAKYSHWLIFMDRLSCCD